MINKIVLVIFGGVIAGIIAFLGICSISEKIMYDDQPAVWQDNPNIKWRFESNEKTMDE